MTVHVFLRFQSTLSSVQCCSHQTQLNHFQLNVKGQMTSWLILNLLVRINTQPHHRFHPIFLFITFSVRHKLVAEKRSFDAVHIGIYLYICVCQHPTGTLLNFISLSLKIVAMRFSRVVHSTRSRFQCTPKCCTP